MRARLPDPRTCPLLGPCCRPWLAVAPQRCTPVRPRKRSRGARCEVQAPSRPQAEDWRSRARAIKEGAVYPAKEFCSRCGLCDTYYVAHVKDACAFLGDGARQCSPLFWCTVTSARLVITQRSLLDAAGMSKIEQLEQQVHGRGRCGPSQHVFSRCESHSLLLS